MKQIKTGFFVLLLSLPCLRGLAQTNAIDRFFNKYVHDSRFTEVSISPMMFSMFSKVNWDQVPQNLKDAISSLQSLEILSTDSTPLAFYQEAIRKIDLTGYKPLMTVRDKDDHVKFLVRGNGQIIHELLMISGGTDEFTLMSLVGNIDLRELSQLGETMNIKGMGALTNLKNQSK